MKLQPLRFLFIAIVCVRFHKAASVRILGSSKCEDLFSHCNEEGKVWQKDGVCYEHQCIAPDTLKMKLVIVAEYRSEKLNTFKVNNMYIKGSGPGLSWQKTIKMERSSTSSDIWRKEIEYTVDSDGVTCASSTHCTQNQKALEFRLYLDDMGKKSMKGPNFYIDLPVSNSISGAADFKPPEIVVHPWFYKGYIRSVRIDNINIYERKRNLHIQCIIFYPPSFNENIMKQYPIVIYAISNQDALYTKPVLEHAFIHEASIDEFVLVAMFINDYNIHPFDHSLFPECKKFPCGAGCFICWDTERAEPCDKTEFRTHLNSKRHCINIRHGVGYGGILMDYLKEELVPRIMRLTPGRIKVKYPQNRLTIMGYAEGATLACFAALTRPYIFGNAACFSPKMYLPVYWGFINEHATTKHLQDQLIKNIHIYKHFLLLYATQKYYIDNVEFENFYWPLVNNREVTDKVIKLMKSSLKLKENDNIIKDVIPKQTLDYQYRKYDYISRLHIPLLHFFSSSGGADQKFSRTQKIPDMFYVERGVTLSKLYEEVKTEKATTQNKTYMDLTKGVSIQTDNDVDDGANNVREGCPKKIKCELLEVPLEVFLLSVALSVFVSSLITVFLMCVRERNMIAAAQDEKEEDELMEELSSDDY